MGLDMAPNAIATECLGLGRGLLEKETATLGPSPSEPLGGE
jgi:hypothetical protein